MKKLTVLLTLMAGIGLAPGQVTHNPGIVNFINNEPTKQGVASHFVTNAAQNQLMVGTQFKAELYYLDTDLNSLMPIPATISGFRASTTTLPGTWAGTSGSVDDPPPQIIS